MRILKISIYVIIQCTWGILQTLFGFLIFIVFINCSHKFYHGCIKTYVNSSFSVSLGLFIFISDQYDTKMSKITAIHEYGHTIQSLILGPFYLVIIGLPSAIWCMLPYFQKMRISKGIPYSSFWVESWADRLGKKFIGIAI